MFRVRNILESNSRLLVLLLTWTLIPTAFAQNPSSEEEHLYNIYRDYYSRPTDQELWNRLVTPVASEVYKIQPGDNLWTISEVFFGDGNYWPKVWSINSRITNPHLIEPGNEIRFQFGTSDAQPSFFITESSSPGGKWEEETYSLASDSLVQGSSPTSADRSGVYIPPSATLFQPVLKTLPPSLPSWQNAFSSTGRFDEWGVDIQKRPPLRLNDKTLLQSFVKEDPVDYVGEVVEKLDADQLMSEGETVYVKVLKGQAQSGQRVLIVNDAGKINLGRSEVKRGDRPDAYVVRVAAEVELVSEVQVDEGRKDFNDDYTIYRARIKKSLDLALPGQKVMLGRIKTINHGLRGRMTDQPVTVIGGNLDKGSFQFSTGNLVFIDRGSDVGLNVGDIIPIQKTKIRQFREKEPLVKYSSKLSGNIQIVDIQGHYSTAVVLSNSEDIRPGDGNRRSAITE